MWLFVVNEESAHAFMLLHNVCCNTCSSLVHFDGAGKQIHEISRKRGENELFLLRIYSVSLRNDSIKEHMLQTNDFLMFDNDQKWAQRQRNNNTNNNKTLIF